MELEGKALFNLLRINAMYDPSIPVEPWQIEDYRQHPTEFLFERLSQLGITLDEKQFITFAKHAESPEQLTELIIDDPEVFDKAYLILFELWRRLLPSRKTASIQCDEICYQISSYEHKGFNPTSTLFEALGQLEEILESSEDGGLERSTILEKVSELCCYDVEGFLFDLIQNLLDDGMEKEAGELIDAFEPYVKKSIWFEFLKARHLFFADEAEATIHLLQLLEVLTEEVDIELLLEIAFFALDLVDRSVLVKSSLLVSEHAKDSATLEQLIEILQQFFEENSLIKEREALEKINIHDVEEAKGVILTLLQELDKS